MGVWVKVTKFVKNIGPSLALTEFVVDFRYLTLFGNVGSSKVTYVELPVYV